MTTFRLLATNCGLSLKDAAAFLAMPEATASAYWKGKRQAPPKAIRKLHALDRRIESLTMRLVAGIEDMLSDIAAKPKALKLKRITTDKAAQAYRLPCASCHEAVVCRVMSNLPGWMISRLEFVTDGEDVEID